MINSQPTGPRTFVGLIAFLAGGLTLVGALIFTLYKLGTFGRWLRVQCRRLRWGIVYEAPPRDGIHECPDLQEWEARAWAGIVAGEQDEPQRRQP